MNNDSSNVNVLSKKIQFGIIMFALSLILQILNQVFFRNSDNDIYSKLSILFLFFTVSSVVILVYLVNEYRKSNK
ncbi:hypothetical protein GFL19_16890 [Acinetobacter baumannii]|nr:hypothetical protein [Acinetobacter baumannii]OCY56441.1 hypothetical protein BFR79_07240 [Acinetobacter pittii]MDR8245681.1 hypothetical protein [Acinetobacter baumannii]MVT93966.1 hypothetical protein [Acinetobacter baumannii]MVU90983.1 hypothetical protein [Acinetobacter baumannii]